MLYVYTLFDPQRDGRPLYTGLFDTDKKELKLYSLYLRGSGRKLYDVEQDISQIASQISSANRVMLNDYKQHVIAFEPDVYSPTVYDVDLPQIRPSDQQFCRKATTTVLKKMLAIKPQSWQNIRANAAVVYAFLQEKGVLADKLRHPIWGWTFSGRSKSSGFSIQNWNGYLANRNGDEYFLHFDWVSADVRALAILSGDQKLDEAFMLSDPYQYMIDHFNQGVPDDKKLTRDEGKKSLLAVVNSFDDQSHALNFYSELGSWIRKCKADIDNTGSLSSILGRRFCVGGDKGDRDAKSVFNGTAQGTIAHAMQVVIRKVWDLYPDNILMENHDSLIVTSDMRTVKEKIVEISRIMVQPFKGILDSNPQFPIVVSVGKEYRKWKEFKRFNCHADIR